MSAAAIAQNMEDAANLATEFIYSLDNVPAEVKHYLEEIKHKDTRAQELQQQIEIDSARWVKHTLKSSGFTLSSSRSLSPSPSSSPAPSISASNSNSSANQTPHSQIPNKITQWYAEIEQLAHEKIALAQKIIDLLTRTCARLDLDLHKVRVLSGEAGEGSASAAGSMPGLSTSASGIIGSAGTGATFGTNASGLATGVDSSTGIVRGWTGSTEIGLDVPVTPLPGRRQSALNAAAAMSASLGSGSGVGAPPNKKRRLTSNISSPSIKLPATATHSRSGSPASTIKSTTTHTRSRLSRQVHPPPAPSTPSAGAVIRGSGRNTQGHGRIADLQDEDAEGDDDADADADADGDADLDADADADGDLGGAEAELEGEAEDEDDGDDDTLYCICQRKSFGDMIACDNENDCPYEWFHLTCVGLNKPLPDKWYCQICEPKVRGNTGSNGGAGTSAASAMTQAQTQTQASTNKSGSSRKGRKK